MDFQLLLPRQVIFGWGKRSEIGPVAATLGKRAAVVCGSKRLRQSSHWKELIKSLEDSDVEVISGIHSQREPTIADVDQATKKILGEKSIDLVIAIGGGAAIDLGKAISAMATNSQGRSVREFLEGVGTGAKLTQSPLPFLAVPATAGTGSEATKNAVISVDDPPCKKSLRSEEMVPDRVIIDPELTVSVPPAVTAASGMDAITQLIESDVSRRATPFTQALCQEGLRLALTNLVKAYQTPKDREAREAMSYAAFLSGAALANSGLGMAHGVAAALGAICNIPHGLACATMLPIALKVNLNVSYERIAKIGRIISNFQQSDRERNIETALKTIEEMCSELSIPIRLRDLGVEKEQLPVIAAGSRGNSMNGNPRELTDQELLEILEEHW